MQNMCKIEASTGEKGFWPAIASTPSSHPFSLGALLGQLPVGLASPLPRLSGRFWGVDVPTSSSLATFEQSPGSPGQGMVGWSNLIAMRFDFQVSTSLVSPISILILIPIPIQIRIQTRTWVSALDPHFAGLAINADKK